MARSSPETDAAARVLTARVREDRVIGGVTATVDALMQTSSAPSLGGPLDDIYATVLRRSPAQPEFHQAVREVLETIGPVVAAHPEYM
ncbi:MAG TPA: hypothetical protein VFZ00_02090, partial [Solirubrobacter sp.]|nr:hypothetical protein [Solirubrobacter sp.]